MYSVQPYVNRKYMGEKQIRFSHVFAVLFAKFRNSSW